MLNKIDDFFGLFVNAIAPILFMEINGFPLIADIANQQGTTVFVDNTLFDLTSLKINYNNKFLNLMLEPFQLTSYFYSYPILLDMMYLIHHYLLI